MGPSLKGSQRHLQHAVTHRAEGLATAIGDALPALRSRRINWVSPLPPDHREFYDGAFLAALGLGAHRTSQVRSALSRLGVPARHPMEDRIGIAVLTA